MASKSSNLKLTRKSCAKAFHPRKLNKNNSSTATDRKMHKSLASLGRLIQRTMTKVEFKAPVPAYRGSDAPSLLQAPPVDFKLLPTEESKLIRTTMSRLFAGKIYSFRLCAAFNMSSSGAGIVNSTLSNSALASNSDFSSLAVVFNEFFVKRFDVKWEPVSMYNYPLTGSSTLSVSSLPLGCADQQHAAGAYTNLTGMTENWRFAFNNTGRPFQYSWINSEKSDEGINPTDLSSGGTTQSWAMTADVASYSGYLQFLTQSAPPALPFSEVLGTFLVEWDVLFRTRE
jgi:hypothetical protein